jgi:thiamine-phosphate pyrophosphorylase
MRLLLYYITDRKSLGRDEDSRREKLLQKVAEAARSGVDFIQLRETDLPARQLEDLAQRAVAAVRFAGSATKILINSRLDVALAVGADGVHLRSDDLAASQARAVWAKSTRDVGCCVAVSCHSMQDVLSAESHGADFVVFGPMFGKQGTDIPAKGLDALTTITGRGRAADPKVEAGQTLRMPVLALGGVTVENAEACIRAGATGIAGIRLFQTSDISQLVTRLRPRQSQNEISGNAVT